MSKEREELLSYLKKTRADLVDLARSLTAAEMAMPTDNPGWSVKDTLCHAVASEAGLTGLAVRFANGEGLPQGGPDLHTRNQHSIDERRDCSIGDLTSELTESRFKLFETIAAMSDQELATPASFPPGHANTVSGVFRMIGQHEEGHGNEMRKAVGK